MDVLGSVNGILKTSEPHLTENVLDGGPVKSIVVMTCGIAGAGKSTLAKAIIAAYPAWTRLSIDTILAERRGIWGVDYPPELYETYQDEAEKVLNASLDELLRQGKNAVLDRSFYAREDREEIKGRIEAAGGRWCLVYLKADRDLLWRRIRERREKGINADSALDIKEELLDSYVEGFEAPQGEGEIVVDVE